MSVLPSGRLSAVETDKGLLQIQTEFILNPSKAIVTSHIFSGRVVRKKQTPWPGVIEKDIDKRKAEEALSSQHTQEVEFAVSKWQELIIPIFEDIQKASEEDKLKDLKAKLAPLAGIKRILLLDRDFNYSVLKNDGTGTDFPEIEFVRKMLAFGQGLSAVSRVGKLEQFTVRIKEGQHLLQVWGEKYFLLWTEPQADLARIKTSIQLALAGV